MNGAQNLSGASQARAFAVFGEGDEYDVMHMSQIADWKRRSKSSYFQPRTPEQRSNSPRVSPRSPLKYDIDPSSLPASAIQHPLQDVDSAPFLQLSRKYPPLNDSLPKDGDVAGNSNGDHTSHISNDAITVPLENPCGIGQGEIDWEEEFEVGMLPGNMEEPPSSTPSGTGQQFAGLNPVGADSLEQVREGIFEQAQVDDEDSIRHIQTLAADEQPTDEGLEEMHASNPATVSVSAAEAHTDDEDEIPWDEGIILMAAKAAADPRTKFTDIDNFVGHIQSLPDFGGKKTYLVQAFITAMMKRLQEAMEYMDKTAEVYERQIDVFESAKRDFHAELYRNNSKQKALQGEMDEVAKTKMDLQLNVAGLKREIKRLSGCEEPQGRNRAPKDDENHTDLAGLQAVIDLQNDTISRQLVQIVDFEERLESQHEAADTLRYEVARLQGDHDVAARKDTEVMRKQRIQLDEALSESKTLRKALEMIQLSSRTLSHKNEELIRSRRQTLTVRNAQKPNRAQSFLTVLWRAMPAMRKLIIYSRTVVNSTYMQRRCDQAVEIAAVLLFGILLIQLGLFAYVAGLKMGCPLVLITALPLLLPVTENVLEANKFGI